jgi:hypothetical protein
MRINNMDLNRQRTASAYFVLNVWEERAGGGATEWRGEMLHVDSGATLRFEDWPEMVALIADALDRLREGSREQNRGNVAITQ